MQQRQFKTWEQWLEEHAEEKPEDRDMLTWLHTPISELMVTWNEEAYQEFRAVRRKRRKEKRRK
jgi:hypothetical protein